jgi:hypothetical protein
VNLNCVANGKAAMLIFCLRVSYKNTKFNIINNNNYGMRINDLILGLQQEKLLNLSDKPTMGIACREPFNELP